MGLSARLVRQIGLANAQGTDISLMHASCPANRRHVLTGHCGCRLLAQYQRLQLTNCDTHAASSSGPVFIQSNGNLRVAGIMVAVATKSFSIALPVVDWIDAAAKRDCS